MLKPILSLLLAILLLIFATQNLHAAWVRFVVGPAVQLPLIVIIGGAFIAGYATSSLNYIMNSVTSRKSDDDDL